MRIEWSNLTFDVPHILPFDQVRQDFDKLALKVLFAHKCNRTRCFRLVAMQQAVMNRKHDNPNRWVETGNDSSRFDTVHVR